MRKSMGWSVWAVVGGLGVFGPAGQARAADCEAADGDELVACLGQAGAGDTVTMLPGTFAVSSLSFDGTAGTEGSPIVLQGTLGSSGERLSHKRFDRSGHALGERGEASRVDEGHDAGDLDA